MATSSSQLAGGGHYALSGKLDRAFFKEYNTDVKINRPPRAVLKTEQNQYEFYRKNKTFF